jgi:polar amino acid transport system substrate-binding protein
LIDPIYILDIWIRNFNNCGRLWARSRSGFASERTDTNQEEALMTRASRIAVLAVSAFALGFGTAPARADALDDVMKAGVLKVAVPQDFAPFGSVGKDLQPQGIDIDLARLIAKELKVKVELVPVTSANRIPYLQTKKVELVISSLGKTAEREKILDFSIAYAPFFSGVFGLEKIAVSKPDDLAGKTVGVTRGAIEDLDLTKMAPTTTTMKRFEDNNATTSAFLSGQVDLIATGNVVAAAIRERNPARKLATKFIIKSSPCYVGMNKGEARLLAKVNAILTAKLKSGELNQLSIKWFGEPLPADIARI